MDMSVFGFELESIFKYIYLVTTTVPLVKETLHVPTKEKLQVTTHWKDTFFIIKCQ